MKSLLSVISGKVLRFPAVCRQVQRMRTSDNGHGKCVTTLAACLFMWQSESGVHSRKLSVGRGSEDL